ncbi:hypothetical protein [Streptomyces sp. NPDC127112]|uniref:hypothetical protein n=1 Tax=Streptomyces sp. NPDC127112 TaxID=3345364 RepID=UPI00363496A9
MSHPVPGSPGQVELFNPPEGWSRGADAQVRFTVADLEKLGKGKVLSGTKGEKVMDRKDFMNPPPARCEP